MGCVREGGTSEVTSLFKCYLLIAGLARMVKPVGNVKRAVGHVCNVRARGESFYAWGGAGHSDSAHVHHFGAL